MFKRMWAFLNQPINRKQTLNPKEKIKLLKMLGELLAEGFSLSEALHFIQIILSKNTDEVAYIIQEVEDGKRLDEPLVNLNFPTWVTSQIYLAYNHGELATVLLTCGIQLENEMNKRKELSQILVYPAFLMIFLIGMLLMMRYILLPHLSDGSNVSPAVFLIYQSPYILMGLAIIVGLVIIGVYYFFKNKQKKDFAEFLGKIPVVKGLSKSYYSHYFTKDWSALLQSGLSVKEVVSIMQSKETSKLLKEIGQDMEGVLLEGYPVEKALESYNFLHKELIEIIRHGEKTSNLQKELQLFSKDSYQRLNDDIERLFQYIQPISFLFIALMIVAVYAAMLLPMFESINGM